MISKETAIMGERESTECELNYILEQLITVKRKKKGLKNYISNSVDELHIGWNIYFSSS